MLQVVDTHCLNCGPSRISVLAHKLIKDLPENQRFGGRLRIVECDECGLRYLNPAPAPEVLSQIYDYDVYEDSTNNNPVLMEHFYAKLKQYCPRLESVCEIGCGTGDFLGFLESKGLKATGVEFADSANRKKFAGPMHFGRMEDLNLPEQFDAILLLNVIEHLSDPRDVLRKIKTMLKPGGVLLLRHPNADLFFFKPYFLAVELPKYLYHRRLARRGKKTGFTVVGFQNQHLFYFGRRSVSRMIEGSGLKIEDFSTTDPYNRLRIGKALRKGSIVEAGIASARHVLGAVGLGPECLIVARA